MEIVEFLRARLAEDEAVAREAIADDNGCDEGFTGQYEALIHPPSGIGLAQGGFGEAAARMIVTYASPARVLREVEAKRDIITAAAYWLEYGDRDAKVQATQTLESLSAIYADHPDAPDWLKP